MQVPNISMFIFIIGVKQLLAKADEKGAAGLDEELEETCEVFTESFPMLARLFDYYCCQQVYDSISKRIKPRGLLAPHLRIFHHYSASLTHTKIAGASLIV